MYKVYWLLHTLAVDIAIGITGSYFVVDYDPGKKQINFCRSSLCTHITPPPFLNF
jgi:hypothetical protein